jgi:hypothetical protein
LFPELSPLLDALVGSMRNLPRRRDLISSEGINADLHMAKVLTEDRLSRPGGAPLKVAIAVAVLGVLGMLIVDHGPWNKPKVQPAFIASYSSTGEGARAAGAKVIPTEPKLQVEPEPPVPKPVHPVNPAPQ